MTQTLTPSHPLEGLLRTFVQVKLRAAELWEAYPREIMGFGLLGLVTMAALGATSSYSGQVAAPPPAPPPMIVRPIAPDQALRVNADIPVAVGPNPIAAPFVLTGNTTARAQALNCLASAVYYEAGNQDDNGGRAVAQVVLNRVRHPAFPASICGVVYQGSTRPTGCQFTFTCDGSLGRRPDLDGWRRATRIAEAALTGAVYAPVGWATHYHADYVVPYWAATMAKNAVVGAHLFYRWAGSWGQPAVFAKAYAGREPSAEALRNSALAAVHLTPNPTLAQAIDKIPGAEPLKLSPSQRGDKRIAVRFNLVARKAADAAPHEDYERKFAASDNLKWSLSSSSVADTNQQPLGKSARADAQIPGSAGASAQR